MSFISDPILDRHRRHILGVRWNRSDCPCFGTGRQRRSAPSMSWSASCWASFPIVALTSRLIAGPVTDRRGRRVGLVSGSPVARFRACCTWRRSACRRFLRPASARVGRGVPVRFRGRLGRGAFAERQRRSSWDILARGCGVEMAAGRQCGSMLGSFERRAVVDLLAAARHMGVAVRSRYSGAQQQPQAAFGFLARRCCRASETLAHRHIPIGDERLSVPGNSAAEESERPLRLLLRSTVSGTDRTPIWRAAARRSTTARRSKRSPASTNCGPAAIPPHTPRGQDIQEPAPACLSAKAHGPGGRGTNRKRLAQPLQDAGRKNRRHAERRQVQQARNRATGRAGNESDAPAAAIRQRGPAMRRLVSATIEKMPSTTPTMTSDWCRSS